MKTFANANHPSVTKTLQVHGGMAVTALTVLIGITAEHVKAEATFDIGDNTLALLFNTGSYERELVPFVQAHSSQFPHLNVEMIQINGTNYIAVTLKEEKKEVQTIKELNDSSFNVRSLIHIGYATAPDYHANVIKSNKTNLSNRLPGAYQALNHPSFLEGKNFWLINNYNVGPEVLQRFIDQTKNQVPFDLEVVKINSFYYIAMTEKEQPKEEVKKEELFIDNKINDKARLTLHELNCADFSKALLNCYSTPLGWSTLNFGGALAADRQAFIDHHNNLGGQYEFCLHSGLVHYRTRPEEVKEEPKTEMVNVVQVADEKGFLTIFPDTYNVEKHTTSLAAAISDAKDTLSSNDYDDEGEILIYQLIGTVKRIVKYESTAQEVKTNPLADAANHPAKTNGAYSEENQEQAYQQYAGGF